MKTLIVVTGPTGVGKSDFAIHLAERLHTEIISADSRQMFCEIPITTAAPTASQLQRVRHHLVGNLSINDYYSASMFEHDALECAADIWTRSDFAILCGGSMMYVDAVCNGIDDIPTVPEELRKGLMSLWERNGDEWLLDELFRLDPDYFNAVDRCNMKRVFHAVEICHVAGAPYSRLRTGRKKTRPFHILKFCLTAPRELLFDRINKRVGKMVDAGMIEEAARMLPHRNLNSLNTVGFKELFAYFDGQMTMQQALDRIRKNTRVYAKKQLTWFKRDPRIRYISITDLRCQE